jgi:anti-sigma factor RsiW
MCEGSEKLIAWLDEELPEGEAADVRRQLESCGDCRRRVESYRRVTTAIHGYCDAAMKSDSPRGVATRWTATVCGVAAAVALLLVLQRGRIEPWAHEAPAVATASATAAAGAAAEAPRVAAIDKSVHRVRGVRRQPVRQQQNRVASDVHWVPAEPAVQIAIPADAMFAPGAVPQGVSFTAELTIGPDGSAQQLRLRP